MVAAVAVSAALLQGLYYPKAYAVGSIVIWVAVLVGLLSRALPSGRVASPATIAGLCLAGVVVLAGASMAWVGDQGRAFEYAVRASAYLGLFTLAACTATPRGRGEWIAGLTIGLAIVSVLAVASWLQPGLLDHHSVGQEIPDAVGRLSYPIGYWNGLAALLAVGTALLAYAGTRAPDSRLRAAAVAAMPVSLLGIWLTTSRGAVVAVFFGLAVLVAVSGDRLRQLIVCALGLAGGGLLIVTTTGMNALTDGLTDATARSQGDWLSLILVAVVLLTGAAALLLDGRELRLRLSRNLAVGLVASAAIAAVIAIALADPSERFQEFKQAPSSSSSSASAVAGASDLSGNGRWQLWGEAIDAFESAPVAGIGIGGYEDWWAQHAPIALFARNAHSLPLQQLAELGLLGGGLMLGFAGAVIVAARRRWRASPDGDAGVLLAVLAVGGLSAAIDWTWEFAAVFGPAVMAAGLLTASAPGDEPERDTYALGLGTVAIAWLAVVSAALVLVTELKLEQSRTADEQGQVAEAIDRAKEARTVQPWSPEPYIQLAVLEEQRNHLDAAVDYLRQAESRDSEDWRLPNTEARLQDKRGDTVAGLMAFERARALNPRARYLGGSG